MAEADWISAMLPVQGNLALAGQNYNFGIYPFMAFSPYGVKDYFHIFNHEPQLDHFS
jgi:hypothetical protein